MVEDADTRLRRLRMRSWRRGTKEMDLILGPFADGPMAGMPAPELDAYEALLDENDQDLYAWITARIDGKQAGPAAISSILDAIAQHTSGRFAPKM